MRKKPEKRGLEEKLISPDSPRKKKMFAVRIDVELIRELKHLSVDLETPISALVEEAIRNLLEREKKSKTRD